MSSTFFWSIFFSTMGFCFFAYGRKHNLYFLLAGFVLILFPLFVSNLFWLIGIGALAIVVPILLQWIRPV